MKNKILIGTTILGVILLCAISCRDPFNPPSTTANLKYLVVDGFLNSTDGSCTIMLSRSIPLSDDGQNPGEEKAVVKLEDSEGNSHVLAETNPGKYSISNLTVNASAKYRLTITTQANAQYQSDFVEVKQTPPIDSITWGSERIGIPIYITTHDPANNTHFYAWSYQETWAYDSKFASSIELKDGEMINREVDIYHCWKDNRSSEILIATSNKLNQDVISNFILTNIPWTSPKLGIRYSILVQQRAITNDAYEYLGQLKKNTENIGTLFDPLPSNITGNITCLSDPDELALGYFTAGSVQQERIFISAKSINRTGKGGVLTGYEGCTQDTVLLANGLGGELPISGWYKGPTLVGYYVSAPSCVDCRYQGGNNFPPDFWEN